MPATSSGGKAKSRRNADTSWLQTKKGRRISVKPGTRSWIIVAIMLIAPRSDEVMIAIMPISQKVWPMVATTASGG